MYIKNIKFLNENVKDKINVLCGENANLIGALNSIVGLYPECVVKDIKVVANEYIINIVSNSTEKEKVYLNTARFLNMINNKDYETAYALLDSGFKANKYPSLDKFIETLKNNLFDYNSIESASKYTTSGDNNIFVLNIKNGEKDDSQKKEITLIMKLKEETDFVMSFSFK